MSQMPIFANVVLHSLKVDTPDVDAQALLFAGSGEARKFVAPERLPQVLHAFNKAINSTFYLSTSTPVAALLTSLEIEWINVKGKT